MALDAVEKANALTKVHEARAAFEAIDFDGIEAKISAGAPSPLVLALLAAGAQATAALNVLLTMNIQITGDTYD